MYPSTPLSSATRRTDDSPISDLMARALSAPDLISLAAGFVDHTSLPAEIVAQCASTMLADRIEGRRSLQYGTTRGDRALREHLIAHLECNEGVAAGTLGHLLDRTIVTSGSQQLLYLVAEALIDPGNIVLVESPTYFVFLGLLKSRGAVVMGIPTDEEGLQTDLLEQTLKDLENDGKLDRVRLIYTVSEHSNPTGLSLASDRRLELVRIAERWSKHSRIFVLEDAAYRGLTFDGAECGSVFSHDSTGETVILARTFSKTFSPGLKTGWGVLPESLLKPILNLKGNHDFGSNNFSQQLLERVIVEGHYERQIEVLKQTYKRKRDTLLSALAEEFEPFGSEVSWTHPKGGLYVWLTLPESIDTGQRGQFFDRCVREGVLYVPGSYAFTTEQRSPISCARLSYGVASEPALREGMRRMASALRAEMAQYSCQHSA